LPAGFGRWWDIRSESARWRRDRRVRSYEDVAAEYYRLRETVRLLAMRAAMDWTVWPRAREPLCERYDDHIDAVRAELSLPRLTALRAGAATRRLPAPEDGPGPAAGAG
jgi:hypothetical protein